METNKMKSINKQFTLLDIVKVCFHRYILLGCVTGATLLVGTIGLNLIGKSKEAYVSTFKYIIPSIQNNKYLDGRNFDFQDVLSRSNIEEVINSNQQYATIKVNKLINSKINEIKYVREYSETTKEVINSYYSLALPKSVFSSKSQAESFINDLLSYPINESINSLNSLNYKIDLDNYSSALRYEDQITYLNNQYNFLLTNYDNLINLYGNVNYENKDLSTYSNEVKTLDSISKIKDLSNEIKQNGYSMNVNQEINTLQLEKKEIQKTITYNEKKIEELKEMIKFLLDNSSSSQSIDIDAYNQKIADLITENIDLSKRLEEIDTKINNATIAPESFINKINKIKIDLENATDKYLEIEESLIKKYSNISFKNKRVVEEKNKTSTIKNGLLSLFAGLVLGCAINLIVDRKYLFEDYPDKKKKEPKVSEE